MSKNRLGFLVIGLLIVGGLVWFWRGHKLSPAVPPIPPAMSAQVPVAPPAPASTYAAHINTTMVPTDLQPTIATNLVPGRMLFLDFAIDAGGMKLVNATGAAGRAKPAAVREGPEFIFYEAFNGRGQLVASGSVEDPMHRRIEFPASTDDGRITSITQSSAGGMIAVRLPGESQAVRVNFYRQGAVVTGAAPAREPLGEFQLRSSLP